MDYKDILLQLVKSQGRIDFGGNVSIDSIWDGYDNIDYFAQYMDADGIHCCPEDDVENVDNYDPIRPDDYDDDIIDELWEALFIDLIGDHFEIIPQTNNTPSATEQESNGFFVITRLHRDDLESAGFDVSNVTDDQMEELAKRMCDDYINQMYWISLETIADMMNIPKKK